MTRLSHSPFQTVGSEHQLSPQPLDAISNPLQFLRSCGCSLVEAAGELAEVQQLLSDRDFELAVRDLTWAALLQEIEEHGTIQSSLQGASLFGADLSGLDLSGVNLQEADLTGANLRNTCLSGAQLRGARLLGVDLVGVRFLANDPLLSGSDDHLEQEILGISDMARTVRATVSVIAGTDLSVFISGEPGTEKERVARAIHASSDRFSYPFIAINCAAYPEKFLEHHLFGTGENAPIPLSTRWRGAVAVAQGGTIFLDEITEMPFDIQLQLLHMIEESRLHRVAERPHDLRGVRWICGSNYSPEQAVDEHGISTDLIDALATVKLDLDPLRQRREDIPAWAEHFLRKAEMEFGWRLRFHPDVHNALLTYAWPGNLLELQNAIGRAAVSASSEEITASDLPISIDAGIPSAYAKEIFGHFDRDYLRKVLDHHHGDAFRTAKTLGIGLTSLRRILKNFGLAERSSKHSE